MSEGYGPVAIFQAVGHADLSRLTALLDSGADPNAVYPLVGNTPLYNACFRDRVDAVQLLLDRGADPNKRLTYCSPVEGRIEKDVVVLMFARSAPVGAALLAAGADPNVQDALGRTPLMRAVLGGTIALVELLIASGALRTTRSKEGETAADVARSRLQWLIDSLPSLKQKEALERKAKLERILELLGESAKTPAEHQGDEADEAR